MNNNDKMNNNVTDENMINDNKLKSLLNKLKYPMLFLFGLFYGFGTITFFSICCSVVRFFVVSFSVFF